MIFVRLEIRRVYGSAEILLNIVRYAAIIVQ